jgi:hypothetical protein
LFGWERPILVLTFVHTAIALSEGRGRPLGGTRTTRSDAAASRTVTGINIATALPLADWWFVLSSNGQRRLDWLLVTSSPTSAPRGGMIWQAATDD